MARRIVWATPAQVAAARALVKRCVETGREPSRVVLLVAQARLPRKPSWMPWPIYLGDLRDRWLDRVGGWIACHVLRRHWVKFGTAPYCTRCGRLP